MRRFPALAVALFSLALPAQVLAQGGPTVPAPIPGPGGAQRPGFPPRDRTAAEPTGTARIRGRILSAESGAPLRRAQVSLFGSEVPVRRATTSDADGRYEFLDLPAGRYTLNASKGGYVGLQYGQRRPFEGGTPVIVSDGQTMTGLDMTLPRGGVIAGRITDEFGEPMAGAQAQAQRYTYGPDGQRRLQPVNGAMSDDLGQFRIYGLMPGEYVVSAGVRGPIMVAPGAPIAEVNEGYPPTFYPGTINVAEAQVITVVVSQETPIQFSLQPARMGRVRGNVVDSSGKPVAGAMVMLRAGTSMSQIGMGGGQTAADGAFTLTNVAPGDYLVEVRPSARAVGETEFASVPVSVPAGDLSGLRITTGKGTTITGRVVFEGQSPRTGSPAPLRVFLQSADPGRMAPMFGGDPISNGLVAEDGTFQLTSASGEVLFRPVTPPGWVLKSVSLEGEDITDEPFDLTGKESVTGLRIVLTDRLTTITGQVTERGAVVKDYMVIVQPANDREGISLGRILRIARADQDGRFRVRGMPPGRYIATAVESLEQGRQFVPEVRSALRKNGVGVSVAEGATVTVDLALTSGSF